MHTMLDTQKDLLLAQKPFYTLLCIFDGSETTMDKLIVGIYMYVVLCIFEGSETTMDKLIVSIFAMYVFIYVTVYLCNRCEVTLV